jgi:hypothetical protein
MPGGCSGGRRTPQPELHIRGDKDVRYERVAQAMAAAQRGRRAQDRLHHRAEGASEPAAVAAAIAF